MKKPRYTESQIFQILKEAESGIPVTEQMYWIAWADCLCTGQFRSISDQTMALSLRLSLSGNGYWGYDHRRPP